MQQKPCTTSCFVWSRDSSQLNNNVNKYQNSWQTTMLIRLSIILGVLRATWWAFIIHLSKNIRISKALINGLLLLHFRGKYYWKPLPSRVAANLLSGHLRHVILTVFLGFSNTSHSVKTYRAYNSTSDNTTEDISQSRPKLNKQNISKVLEQLLNGYDPNLRPASGTGV